MKKILLFSLLLISLSGFAQDWAPMKNGDFSRHFSSALYQAQGPQNKQIQSIILQSFSQDSNANTTTLVFKKGFTRSFTPNFQQIIKSQIFGDTAIIHSDSTIFKTIDNLGFTLSFPHNLFMGKNFTLGINTSNQSLMAIVDSMYLDSVNNMLDSVARMKIVLTDPIGLPQTNSNYHNKEIFLSKLNGMIKGIDFTNLESVEVVDQYFSFSTEFTMEEHHSLTTGDEYHFRDNSLMNSFGDYYETNLKVIGDSNQGVNRTLTFEQKRKKSFPSRNPGSVVMSTFSKTFVKAEEIAKFQSQIIEESDINQTPLINSIVPKVNLYYSCGFCGFNDLGLIKDTTFFSLEYSSFNNKRDTLRNNRNGLYSYDEYIMLGVGDFGYHSYHNGNTTSKDITYVKKGADVWGFPLNLTVGLRKLTENSNELILYPNPAKNLINITTENKVERVEIFDFQGKLVKEFSNQKQLNISSLEIGLYLVKIYSKGNVLSEKFVKE